MGDSEFMNTYVNVALETIHSYVNETLQLKTHLKVVNDLVSQKDQVIHDLNARIESLYTENEGRRSTEGEMQNQMQHLRDNASSWESQYNNIINKVSHMDTLTNQYNDLKKQYVKKETEVNRISDELKSIVDERDSLKNELNTLRIETSKLEKLIKKEEKKSVTPVTNMPSKKVINKESNANTLPLVENVSQEIDDF